jgi:DNA-binding NarL/FixJ family response regulator
MTREPHDSGASAIRPHRAVVKLTSAETEVVTRLARGLSNREIAAELGKSTAAVKYRLAAVYRKLGVNNRLRVLAMFRG